LLLYGWFVIGQGRRETLHVYTTAHPTAAWVIRRLQPLLGVPNPDGIGVPAECSTC
jgi:hypothetical protein